MNCQELRELIADYLTEQLADDELQRFEAHRTGCDKCSLEVEQMESAWIKLEKLPEAEPSPQMRSRFYTMLEEEKRRLQHADKKSFLERFEIWINSWWPRRPALQMAMAALFLVVGAMAGFGLKDGSGGNGDLAQLRDEVQQMRQMVSLSLLDKNASSDRLRGVNMSTGISQPSNALMTSLTNTLESDPNVNVRLAAVDALTMFRDEPGVLDTAVQALAQESSPMVQIALIDLLIVIQEKKALEALRNFIQLKNVDPTVKEHAQERISVVM
jgi:hypothetical protein